MSRRLRHYLKYERKRTGFSQTEVAYLLGAEAKGKVSRYERGRHLPSLVTALKYQVLFGVSVAELFPATYEAARKEILRRAKNHLSENADTVSGRRDMLRKKSIEQLLA